jgi:phage repressor protein C with HTH and peptisase S24 domain
MAFGSQFSMALKDNLARIRKERGLSQQALASLIGVRQNTIAAIETGATKKTRYLADLARALRVDVAELDSDLTKPNRFVGSDRGTIGARDLDLYGSTEGGEGVVVVTRFPVDRTWRPPPLVNVRDGYALTVVSESMSPVIRPGDMLLIHPHLAPRRDDSCVFVRNRGGALHAALGEYRGETKENWLVRTYQPSQREFQLEKGDWQRCHVIVGKYNRR